MPSVQPFHLAFPATDLEATRSFYANVLGCAVGREAERWIDFDFFGHQIVAHKVASAQMSDATSLVDGDNVPVRHFGVVLSLPAWEALAEKFKAATQEFVIEPHVRFRGQPGEQATMFFLDPFGNALEFKAFADPDRLFAK